MAANNKNEEAIFNAAIQLKDRVKRQAYLTEACGDDHKLRADIESLIQAHETESPLDVPIFAAEMKLDDSTLAEGPGTIIGSYKLLELIGEGGFGAVYMAEQEKPIRRRVALKIIKLGMDTKRIIARFEAERQALAMMDHPNIAKVFEAGSTDRGRPYFAMELVKGVPITEYCDTNNLEMQQRLRLFIDVCMAVEHAHQKGIIHRDIKPSNIMVTLHDGRPVVKVIDFGIAKAMQQRLTEKTLFTEFRQLIGTPEYMSPEQAEFSGLDVDTRTDIYSLGILLYELLTGTTPFEAKRLRSASYDEICRIIRETEPPKPSTRLSRLGDKLAEVAKCRHVEPGELCRIVRGDLDWIVMKALEKDRTRRYETSSELAVDIERHLSDQPVSTGPPSAGYRLHKFIRRNRATVITFSLVAAALAIGATAATIVVWNSGDLPGKIQHAAGMVQRHVWDTPPMSDLMGGISPDGRYLSYINWTTGSPAIYDLTTKTNWLVTNDTDSTGKTRDGECENLVISSDSKQIAYSWCHYGDTNSYDLRLINLDGSNFRVLYDDATAVFYIRPYAWSPDGKEILAYFSDSEANLVDEKTGELFRKSHLVLISLADGSVRTLKTWHRRCLPKRAVFSPDGRYVAYEFAQKDDQNLYDIFLMDLDVGGETVLIEHPANDRLFGWSPDGRRIVFTSDRSSRRGLWMIEVAEGVAQGSPRALLGRLEGWPIGFTTDGSFFYGVGAGASNVYLAQFDSTGLNFESEPDLTSSQFVGSTTTSDFSPDGSFLAYRIGSGASGGPLVVYSIETSNERIITSSPSFRLGASMFGPRFSPDGQSLLVYGYGLEGGYGVYTIDVKTGAATLIVSRNERTPAHAVWSPDGKSIYICSVTSLSRFDLATGRETELYQAKDQEMIGFDVSPDGRLLTFFINKNSLIVMSSTGGKLREVVHLKEDEVSNSWSDVFVRWTPDSNHILFSKCQSQLWKVNVETGDQQQIGPAFEGSLVSATIYRDGRQISFTERQSGSQLWVMENFLPD